MQAPPIRIFKEFPKSLLKKETQTLLIFDKKLKKLSSNFSTWSKSFLNYSVQGGESLKNIFHFPFHMEKILAKTKGLSSHRIQLVAVGGGSIGDFSGFVASVLKRGVPLTHIPSTWLAAVDSAHGGKTALNVPPFKNQIGTFYPASQIYLIKELLFTQPESLAHQALSEVIKMALIDGGSFWQKLFSLSQKKIHQEKKKSKMIWTLLKPSISGKWKVIKRDPYEKKGLRQVLNLGHTIGHVLEGLKGLSHSESVAQGLFFSIDWSSDRGLMPNRTKRDILCCLNSLGFKKKKNFQLKKSEVLTSLLQDKKIYDKDHIRFVFLKYPGKCLIQKVSPQDIIGQAYKQNWLIRCP